MRVTVTDRNYIRFMYGSPREHDMARYYGTLQGARGPSSRLGHKGSGLQVTAQSYNGDICVEFRAHDSVEKGGTEKDIVTIYARQHGGGGSVALYSGPVDDLLAAGGLAQMVKNILSHNPKLRRQIVLDYAKDALKERSTGTIHDDDQ